VQRFRIPARAGLAAAAAGCAGLALSAAVALPGAASRPAPVSFATDVQPIFDQKCIACHPVAYPYLDLRRGRSYDALVRVAAATAPAFERVLPGRPELSYLLVHPPDPSLRDLLTTRERETITAWIEEGARDD
jgi:hypothetical protein